jgi:hypothetical protein
MASNIMVSILSLTAQISRSLEYNKIITMAQQPYMGPGLLLPPLLEVTKLCAFVAVGDWSTGRATVSIDPDVGDLGEKWRQFGLRNILLHAVNLRHAIDGLTSPPKEVVLGIFIHRPRSGSNP